jgi:hypothetical protein
MRVHRRTEMFLAEASPFREMQDVVFVEVALIWGGRRATEGIRPAAAEP